MERFFCKWVIVTKLSLWRLEQDLTLRPCPFDEPWAKNYLLLTGHGERDIQTAGNTAYTTAKAALVAKNYTVQSLNLIATNKIPADATAIVIAGSTQPISAAELTLVQDYVSKRWRLGCYGRTTPLTQFGNSLIHLAAYLASTWGIIR